MWNGVCERHATFVFFFRKEKECFNISKGGNRDGCEGMAYTSVPPCT